MILWGGLSTWMAVMKKEQETIMIENRSGIVLQFPVRSLYSTERIRQRKRERAKAFAISCLIAAAIVLGFLLVSG